MKKTEVDYLRELRSIAVKMAAFCARLSGHEGVPEHVSDEGMELTHTFKRVDSTKPVIIEVSSES